MCGPKEVIKKTLQSQLCTKNKNQPILGENQPILGGYVQGHIQWYLMS
jgi:hypothetical protein